MNTSARQREILERISQGEKQQSIAAALGISYRAVQWNLATLRKAARVNSTMALVVVFVRFSMLAQPSEKKLPQTHSKKIRRPRLTSQIDN